MHGFKILRSLSIYKQSLLDIIQQFTFVIKQKEQYTDLTISNNTDRCERQIQLINIEYIYIYI